MFNKRDVVNCIDTVFSVICMKRNLVGSLYLAKVIELTVENNGYLYGGLMKKLYPEIAKIYNTDADKVERGVRYAIDECYKNGKIVLLNEIFKTKIFDINIKPKNGEFIALISDKIKLKLSCDECLADNDFRFFDLM